MVNLNPPKSSEATEKLPKHKHCHVFSCSLSVFMFSLSSSVSLEVHQQHTNKHTRTRTVREPKANSHSRVTWVSFRRCRGNRDGWRVSSGSSGVQNTSKTSQRVSGRQQRRAAGDSCPSDQGPGSEEKTGKTHQAVGLNQNVVLSRQEPVCTILIPT